MTALMENLVTTRIKVMALSLVAATVACVALMMIGAPGVPVQAAHAAGKYHTIKGTAINGHNASRVAGANVYLYRWSGGRWVNMGKKATTNRYGNYKIRNARKGYYYKVRAYRTYGDCWSTGYFATYDGFSKHYYSSPRISVATARVLMYFQGYIYC